MNTSNIIRVKELSLDKIHPNCLDDKFGGSKIVVIGKPGSGKSTMIKSIIYAKKHLIPAGIVFSGSEDSNGFYSQFVPSTFIFNNETPNLEQLKQFIERQKKACKKKLANPWSLCLIDDCTDDKKVFNDPTIIGMYKRGRHWKMLHILSLQYSLDIKPNIRTNIDGTFILRENGFKQRKQLYENYASMIPSFDLFCVMMDQLTLDYTAMYIDNTNPNGDWKDNVYWYKAKIPPDDFKFGCDELWHWHYQKFDDKSLSTIAQ